MINIFNIKTPFQGIIIGLAFFVLGNSLLNFDSDVLKGLLCIIGWVFILYNIHRIRRFYYSLNGIESFLFKTYIVLVVVMVVRGYIVDYRYIWQNWLGSLNYHIFSPTYILPYFLPLFIFIGIKRIEFRTLLQLNYMFNFLFLFFFIINIESIYKNGLSQIAGFSIENSQMGLAADTVFFFTSTSFFVLCKDFIPKKQWRFNMILLFLAIITLAVGSRRGGVAIFILLLLGALLIYVQSFKGFKKIFGLIAISLVTLGLTGFYFASQDTLFKYINERGAEDTRSIVDVTLLQQMSSTELWLGKGLNGRYYLPILEDDYLDGWRYGSETGFYNLVLKGGYVLAIIYIFVLLIPALKGIFKSNNSLTKALGIYILLSLIELYPFGWLQFDLKYFVIWIGVIFCWSPAIRRMNNLEIKKNYF